MPLDTFDPSITGADMVGDYTPVEQLRREWGPASEAPVRLAEVWVRFQQEGWHNWPDAPEHRAYLRASHRHMFWYEVRVVIGLDEFDRGIEFHDLLQYCRDRVQGPNLGANSCEMLAHALALDVQVWAENVPDGYRHRMITVSVSEDGECGATVTLG